MGRKFREWPDVGCFVSSAPDSENGASEGFSILDRPHVSKWRSRKAEGTNPKAAIKFHFISFRFISFWPQNKIDRSEWN